MRPGLGVMEVVAVVVEAAEVEAMVVVDMGEVVEVEATVRIIFFRNLTDVTLSLNLYEKFNGLLFN